MDVRDRDVIMTGTASDRIRVRRIYEPPAPDDGTRILVDRLWPRGMSKERADLDQWCKDVAPSNQLRKWYGHVPDRFDEFARRYRDELTQPEQAAEIARLRGLAAEGNLTLLTATKQPEISEAGVLQQLLSEPDSR